REKYQSVTCHLPLRNYWCSIVNGDADGGSKGNSKASFCTVLNRGCHTVWGALPPESGFVGRFVARGHCGPAVQVSGPLGGTSAQLLRTGWLAYQAGQRLPQGTHIAWFHHDTRVTHYLRTPACAGSDDGTAGSHCL